MDILSVGSYQTAPKIHAPRKAESAAIAGEEKRTVSANRDTVEISGKSGETGKKGAAKEEGERSGMVGINAARLARQLAAAKTRSQVQAVMAEIRSDLQECDSGAARGMDVDRSSYAAAQRLLQEAQSRMGQAENREPTPEEEMAAALASLM